jgi:hypothetical protein
MWAGIGAIVVGGLLLVLGSKKKVIPNSAEHFL